MYILLACLSAASFAFANRPVAVNDATHNWIDENGQLFLIKATVAQAELECPGNDVFCLRATDVPSLIVRKSN